MLRFDVPQVWSNVARWEAFLTFLFCAIALAGLPWIMALLAVQGFVRGFFGHYREPAHQLWHRIAEKRGWGGKKENAGAKMFANKILFLASTAAVLLYASGSSLWVVPCYVLIVFSSLEWALSFCAACWAYGVWYRFFPPST
ncbi:MAG: DUF4395 domain-containing protein [Betaproteobacteria bacterium]|nr:DUF4395 domain-containing protein [Betaproteobacteria bacterium]